MSLKEKLATDLKQAMRDKNTAKLSAIRAINTEIKNREIKIGKYAVLSDEDIQAALQSEIKKLKDSYEAYEKVGYIDRAADVKAQMDALQDYLPKQMSAEEITALVSNVISEKGKNKGEVMKAIMPIVKGKADGSLVNKIVTSLLA